MIKVYCDSNANIKSIKKSDDVTLYHFPYDSRENWQLKHQKLAKPSEAQWRDIHTTWVESEGLLGDYTASDKLSVVLSIIGSNNRRDALHLDSAYKEQCDVFLTEDRNTLKHREELENLLGLKIFSTANEQEAIECIKLLKNSNSLLSK